jgi:hypothetical protein
MALDHNANCPEGNALTERMHLCNECGHTALTVDKVICGCSRNAASSGLCQCRELVMSCCRTAQQQRDQFLQDQEMERLRFITNFARDARIARHAHDHVAVP